MTLGYSMMQSYSKFTIIFESFLPMLPNNGMTIICEAFLNIMLTLHGLHMAFLR